MIHERFGNVAPDTAPVTSLASFTEQGLSELKQHLAGEPVDASRISGTLGLAGVTGQVTSAGAITAGTGFTVNHSGTGIFIVTFTAAFSAAPTVQATVLNVTALRVIFVMSVTTTTATLNVRNGAAALADEAFHFVAFATV